MLQQNVMLDTSTICYKPPNMLKIVITVMYDVMGLVIVDSGYISLIRINNQCCE